MKINFLGDSITQGGCASTTDNYYVNTVGRMLGCEVVNYGVGGTRIARQLGGAKDFSGMDEHYIIRARRMGEADVTFVFGGTNDYGHGDAPFGEYTDNGDSTFCGALRELIEYLVEKYGKEKLCFILPLPRYNQSNPLGDGTRKTITPPLTEYIELERKMVGEYGIDMIDMSDIFPVPDTDAQSELFFDGLHPNDAGHKLIAERICEYVRAR